MFERFTSRARKVLVLAQHEAAECGHAEITSSHLLLGLVGEGEGVAGQVLADAGFEVGALRQRIVASLPPSAGAPPKKAPFTPQAKKVLELALREALNLGHTYIGTEHLLLGLLRDGDGFATQLVVEKMGTVGEARARVIDRLRSHGKEVGKASRLPLSELLRRPAGKAPSPLTPGAEAAIATAEAIAAGANEPAVGSQHLLLGIVDQTDSLGGRVAMSFGLTREAVTERANDLGADGTTDEMPKPDPYTVHASEGGVTIRIEDEELAAKVRSGELTVTFKPTA